MLPAQAMQRPSSLVERVDVLVIGLGPAGAAAAAEAARAGHAVLAIDRKRVAGVPVQCAEFVPAIIGTEVSVLARTVRQPIDSMRTFVENDAPDLQPNFPGHMLDRAAFDAMLIADARAAGARCSLAVTARIDHGVGGGRVLLSDGRSVAPRVIVGADGPRSLVGRAIGAINVHCVQTRQIKVPLLRPQRSTDIFLSAGIAGGYGWMFPQRDVANLGAGVISGHRAQLKAIVAGLHCTLAGKAVVGNDILAVTGGAIPVGGMLQPSGALAGTLVLLAGDAAGLTNPITGAGIAAAVISGRLAGRAAAAHLQGEGDAAAAYRDELQALFGASLARALWHRRRLEEAWRGDGAPTKSMLRQSWIAFPQYWAAPAAARMEVMA